MKQLTIGTVRLERENVTALSAKPNAISAGVMLSP
jgi:hypothetical protein